jgi:hypothetical protein
MIGYCRIGRPACDFLLNFESKASPQYPNCQERFAFFEYQLGQWEQRNNTDFQLAAVGESTSQANQFLHTLFRLRANHLRVLMSRPFLWTNPRIISPPDIWPRSVGIATNTIEILAGLDTLTKTYRFQQTQLNYFLVASLGILLLAITQKSSIHSSLSSNAQHIPVPLTTFIKANESATVAINLLRNQAKYSHHSQCMWERVRNLAYRLNLFGILLPNPSKFASRNVTEDSFASHLQANSTVLYPERENASNCYGHTESLSLNEDFLHLLTVDITQDLEYCLTTPFWE